MERAFGPRHPNAAAPRVGLANIALARGDHAAAREHAERATSILAESEANTSERADAELVLACALWWEPSERTRAHALARRAHETYARSPESNRLGLARATAWLDEHPAPAR